jgi:hypothetical protein
VAGEVSDTVNARTPLFGSLIRIPGITCREVGTRSGRSF